jgi:hypothetical protein
MNLSGRLMMGSLSSLLRMLARRKKGKMVVGQKHTQGPVDHKPTQSKKGVKSRWLWIRKGSQLDNALGFQASATEIRRFGSTAWKLVPVKPSFYNERSFAEVVKRGIMARDGGKARVDLGRDRQRGANQRGESIQKSPRGGWRCWC